MSRPVKCLYNSFQHQKSSKVQQEKLWWASLLGYSILNWRFSSTIEKDVLSTVIAILGFLPFKVSNILDFLHFSFNYFYSSLNIVPIEHYSELLTDEINQFFLVRALHCVELFSSNTGGSQTQAGIDYVYWLVYT